MTLFAPFGCLTCALSYQCPFDSLSSTFFIAFQGLREFMILEDKLGLTCEAGEVFGDCLHFISLLVDVFDLQQLHTLDGDSAE